MELRLPEPYDALLVQVRTFLDEHWDARRRRDPAAVRDFRALATDRGYLFGWVPRELGGGGTRRDALATAVVDEAFWAARAPYEPDGMGVNMVVPTLLEWGSPDQQRRYVPPTLVDDVRWCQGYSEPTAGSDLGSIRTRARRDGGAWVIAGHKIWTSGADTADLMFLLARTDADRPGPDGLSYFLLDMHQPGVTVRPLRQLTGGTGFAEVHLDGARTTDLVGEPGRGWSVSRSTLRHERSMVGGTRRLRRLYAGLSRLAEEPRADGTRPVEEPRVRDELVRIHTLVEEHRWSAWLQARQHVLGRDAGIAPLTAKLRASEIADRVSALLPEVLGDEALLDPATGGPGGHPAPRRWMHQWIGSLGLSIAAGTSNIQRDIIARRGLGLPDNFAPGSAPSAAGNVAARQEADR